MDALIRLLVIDDHPLMVDGALAHFSALPDMTVVGTAIDPDQGIALIGEVRPDVVLCDIMFGSEPLGLSVVDWSNANGGPPILLMSLYDHPALHASALDHGAAGYVQKTSSSADIAAAIRTVSRGGSAFSINGLRLAHSAIRRPSGREIEIIERVGRGASNASIAHECDIEVKTVESHLRRLFVRYRVQNRTELALLAVSEGWIIR
jgi:DNA-binding NarL/FixJ family response regulator